MLQEGAPIHCKTEDADLPWSSSEDRAPMLSLAGPSLRYLAVGWALVGCSLATTPSLGAQAKHVSDQDMAQDSSDTGGGRTFG